MGTNSIYTSSTSTSNSLNNLNPNQNTSKGQVISPKTDKSYDVNYEEARIMMMKKRSPTKNEADLSITSDNKSQQPHYKN